MSESLSLPFESAVQLAVIGHCFNDKAFYEQCAARVKETWFSDTLHARVWKAVLAFKAKFNRLPSYQELRDISEIQLEQGAAKEALKGVVHEAVLKAKEIQIDTVRSQLTEWYHARLFKEASEKANQQYNARNFSKSYGIVTEAVKRIQLESFNEDLKLSFANAETWLKESEEGYSNGALTTGLSVLDAALSSDGQPNPALYRGDTTVILAPINCGKSTAMITIACHNIRQKKSVLFYTHEGRKEDIREKVLQSFTRNTKTELFNLYRTPEGLKKINDAVKGLELYLEYVPFNRPGMTVEQVMADIAIRQHKRKLLTGKGFDLLVSDYPAKLTTERAKGGALAQRNIDAIIYDQYVQFALQENIHALVAIQTNRAGSVANRDEERLLTMEDVAESWGVMANATNVISLNRSEAAARNDTVTFYVAKSRSSERGRAIAAKSAYAKSLTHSDSLGGCWYKGSETLADQADRLINEFKGQEVPTNERKVSKPAGKE